MGKISYYFNLDSDRDALVSYQFTYSLLKRDFEPSRGRKSHGIIPKYTDLPIVGGKTPFINPLGPSDFQIDLYRFISNMKPKV